MQPAPARRAPRSWPGRCCGPGDATAPAATVASSRRCSDGRQGEEREQLQVSAQALRLFLDRRQAYGPGAHRCGPHPQLLGPLPVQAAGEASVANRLHRGHIDTYLILRMARSQP